MPSRETKSAFDAHHPPATEIIDKCVHCGFCLPACPTYVLWGEEMDSPRGRIYLMKMAAEGKAEMNAQWVNHFDTCLGCVSCMSACPSGVDYGKLIEATRAQIERNHPRSLAERLQRKLLFATFPQSDRMNAMRGPLRLYQKSGLQSAVRASGILGLMPESLRAMEELLPEVKPIEPVPAQIAAVGAKRKRVGLVLGCVQRSFFSHVNAATARVLAAEGCEVIAPAEQSCCGALMVHAGEEEQAIAYAKQLIDTFEQTGVDEIISNAAGCGSNLKEYGHLLRDDPSYDEKAKRFSAKCRDVCEILAELTQRAERHPLKLRVAIHDPCHLQHAQGVKAQPRSILAGIPGLELLEIPEGPICCGSAGIYNLVQPNAARELGDRKAALIKDLNPDVVATGNPGCLIQLDASLKRASKPTPILHTMELLDASMRGISERELLGSNELLQKYAR